MSIERAVSLYQGNAEGPKLNCSQAVAAAFKTRFGLSEDQFKALSGCGAGRAPGGVCGALHAAKILLVNSSPAVINECEGLFRNMAGSLHCREIRSLRQLSCSGCVKTAAEYLDKLN